MSNNLVKHDQLNDILGNLWGKVKNRDITAGEVTANADGTNRKLNLKRKDNQNTVEIDFTNVALLDKINEFKKYGAFPDVALDELKSLATEDFGTSNPIGGYDTETYWSGCRNFTSDMFYDGYVNKIRVHLRSNLSNSTVNVPDVEVHFVEKKESLATDVVRGKINAKTYQVITNNGQKYIEIPVEQKFDVPTYFLINTTTGQNARSVTGIDNTGGDRGVVHIPRFTNVGNKTGSVGNLTIGNTLLNTGNNATSWCINYEVIGRMSVKEAIDIITSEDYVLVSDTTVTGGTADKAGKVVKLGTDGKLDNSVIPELAINRVLTAANQGAVQSMIGNAANQIQIGDVVVLEDSKKVYMYKGQTGSTYNFDNDFLELTMGTGTVKKINGGIPDATGNVAVTVAGTDGIKMNFGTGGQEVTIATYMTTQEVTEIKALFTFD